MGGRFVVIITFFWLLKQLLLVDNNIFELKSNYNKLHDLTLELNSVIYSNYKNISLVKKYRADQSCIEELARTELSLIMPNESYLMLVKESS